VRVTYISLIHKEDQKGLNEVSVLMTFQQKIMVPVDSRCQLLYSFMYFSFDVRSPKIALYGVLSDFALGLFYRLDLSLHLRTIQRL
jgi:hypothetical protein